MPSNAPATQKAGPITLTGWPRLQPDATQAQTLGMATLAMSDWLPHRADPIWLLDDDLEGRARGDRRADCPEAADKEPRRAAEAKSLWL
jgi:hypothetical protein